MNYDFQIEPIFESSWTRTIVFAPDENFVKYFGVALQSLIENSKNYEDYDIIVLEADISYKNKRLLYKMLPPNFCLRFFNINECIKQNFGNHSFKTTAYWSISTYYRLFIPLIMQKYKKVLYCDSDLVFTENLQELFEIDFADKEILAVIDPISPIISSELWLKKHFLEELHLSEPEKYFNAGVIMFNLANINHEQYFNKLCKIIAETKLVYLDQDILNILFEHKTKHISCKWNYQWGINISRRNYDELISGEYRKDFLEAQEKPAIIHYTTNKKPWFLPYETYAHDFWGYARRCPFYEEILYKHLKCGGIKEDTLKNINLKWKIYYNYYRTKLLSFVTIGKKRTHYQEKRDRLKQRVKDIRKFSRL